MKLNKQAIQAKNFWHMHLLSKFNLNGWGANLEPLMQLHSKYAISLCSAPYKRLKVTCLLWGTLNQIL